MATVHVDPENYEKEVKKSDIPIIIDCYADWCGPCQMFGPKFEKVSGEFEGKIKFCKLNVDESQAIAQEYGVRSIPCIIFLKEGKEVDRVVGAISEDDLKEKAEKLL